MGFSRRRQMDFAAMLREADRPVSPGGGGAASALTIAASSASPLPRPSALTEAPNPVDVAGSSEGPPHFTEVPDSVKWPLGPYRQAPAEYGGEWWYVSPFTGEEPWLVRQDPGGAPPPGETEPPPEPEPPSAPEGFEDVFGPQPSGRGPAAAQWEIDREHFKGVGVPEGFTQEQVDQAAALFEAWGMGRPIFYEGRYGWKARFPESGINGYEANPFAAIETPHLVVARFQVRQAQKGGGPPERHPFVPASVFGEKTVHA